MPELETFINAGQPCIVFARSGTDVLIIRPGCSYLPYVVPLEHKPGETEWLNGKYFKTMEEAWDCYEQQRLTNKNNRPSCCNTTDGD